MKTNPLPSQERLKELFDYDPETGDLLRKENPKSCRPLPKKVGSIHKTGHLTTKIQGVGYKVHRLIYKWMTGEEPQMIDHINRIPSDNRWVNLRSANHFQNKGNNIAKGFYQTQRGFYVEVGGKYAGFSKCPLLARLIYEDKHAEHYGEYSPYYTKEQC